MAGAAQALLTSAPTHAVVSPVHLLAHPDAALIISSVGLLLLFVECNRPGLILPGATGLLFLLLGTEAVARQQLRPGALYLLALASAVLALPLRYTLGWRAAATGTALLCLALVTLPSSPGSLSPAVGVVCALMVGPLAGWLAIVAGHARRGKRRLYATNSSPLPTGQEHWE